MSKTAASLVARCRLPCGGFRSVVAALVFLPAATLAANADPTLRPSDQVDLGRLGKVSEDERSVLRMEWRAGLAGVEETRSVEEMLDKLRRLERGISDVSHLVRNLPAQAPGAAAAAPVAAIVPAAADAPVAGGYDFRLMVANLVAFALVALWWFRRRKSVAQPGMALPPLPQQAPPAAAQGMPAHPDAMTPAIARVAVPVAPPSAEPAATSEPVALPEPAVIPEAATAPASGSDAQRETATAPATVASPAPPEMLAAESVSPTSVVADQTGIFDFSLEEADPETVERENARLATVRPASPSQPEPAAPAAPKVDIEPTLQLAEIMLSMGLEEGAAQALIEYTEAHPRHAIYHWLKLLGIYRSRGLQQEFAKTAEKLRMYFNIQAAEWGSLPVSEVPTLENFARIAQHVQKIWSQQEECLSYLQHLLEDNRDGERAGFPQSVAEEILLLVEVQKDLAGRAQPPA